MRLVSITGLAALALTACDVREGGGNQTAAANNEAEDMTPEEAGIFGKLLGGGEPVKLGIQENHANGGVLSLNSIQVKPTETVMNVTYVNGHTNDIQLNWSTKKTFLTTGGRKFYLSPPVGDSDVRVRSGATMTGDLVFMGAVPETRELQLVVNDGMERSGEYSSIPGFLVDIPVTPAAYSDDGSKKN